MVKMRVLFLAFKLKGSLFPLAAAEPGRWTPAGPACPLADWARFGVPLEPPARSPPLAWGLGAREIAFCVDFSLPVVSSSVCVSTGKHPIPRAHLPWLGLVSRTPLGECMYVIESVCAIVCVSEVTVSEW